jgi:N4-gp56 family major capsid protein
MARTIVGLNDAKAVKRFSAFLAVDTARISYFNKKFMGVGADTNLPIQLLPQLESDAGENISFDLSMQLRQQPIEGDDVQEGTEEDLKFYTDSVYIDQMRGGVDAGGRMTRKRTIHDLRRVARARQSEWWSRIFDELHFMYLSGSRGANSEYIFGANYTGFANNALTAPSATHQMYADDATSQATLIAGDIMDLTLVDRAVTKAEMMGGGSQGVPSIQPIMIDGEEHYVLLMSPFQAYDLRTATGSSDWLEIQKAAATAEGRKSPIFKGGLGMHNGVVLHKHKGVIRFDDAGAGSDVAAARALFLGSQAAVCAFGSPGTGLRFDWHEESRDNGNQLVISTSSIFGTKKTSFTIDGTATDFGVMALDTAAADPG